ncbi:MAG TPA: FG-GAP-like repeat-containing protein [Flavitalea sp.]|nr:FG-GAP-like repeat-containing protein [Flavitalea sp.]
MSQSITYRFLIYLLAGSILVPQFFSSCSTRNAQQKSLSAQLAFEAQTIDSAISIGYGITTGDVDGDGRQDILLADKKQIVWYRNSDWKKFLIAENLTESDNVCIAARDINGDGKVEVAVGAQWNPGETTDTVASGAVFYLERTNDPTVQWRPIKLSHEPTVHRMKWIQSSPGNFQLVVVPLHGRGNKGGEGNGVKVYAYQYTPANTSQWPITLLDSSMHLTHNFEIIETGSVSTTGFYLGGKEGVRFVPMDTRRSGGKLSMYNPTGEIRTGHLGTETFFSTIEPMHGNQLVVYEKGSSANKLILDDELKEGHALATGDFLGTGSDMVVAGWRTPNAQGKVGIKIYWKSNADQQWKSQWIDENGMACEDLLIKDLNGDGKPDIIASGRSTKNVKIYWNRAR